MASSIGFHILFQNGRAKQAGEQYATIHAYGQRFVCIDSPIQHEWDMTPGIAPFIDCDSDDELDSAMGSFR